MAVQRVMFSCAVYSPYRHSCFVCQTRNDVVLKQLNIVKLLVHLLLIQL